WRARLRSRAWSASRITSTASSAPNAMRTSALSTAPTPFAVSFAPPGYVQCNRHCLALRVALAAQLADVITDRLLATAPLQRHQEPSPVHFATWRSRLYLASLPVYVRPQFGQVAVSAAAAPSACGCCASSPSVASCHTRTISSAHVRQRYIRPPSRSSPMSKYGPSGVRR